MLLTIIASCSEADVVEKGVIKPLLEVDLPDGNVITASTQREVIYIPIKSNVSWSIQKPESEAWYDAVPLTEKNKNLVSLTIHENLDVNKRQGSFIVKGAGVPNDTINIIQLGQGPDLIADHTVKTAALKGEVFKVTVTASIDYAVTTASALNWIEISKLELTRAMATSGYKINVTPNPTAIKRYDTILITPKEPIYKHLTIEIPISQEATLIDDVIPSDIKVGIESVVLTRGNTYGGEAASLSIDEKYGTHYSSSSTPLGDSVILDYTVKGSPDRIDLVKLVQRADQNVSSIFTSGSVWYKSESQLDWKCANRINVGVGENALVSVNIPKPTHVRVCINSRTGGAVALAEVELWEIVYKGDIESDLKYFEDDSYSKLKATTTNKDVQNISNPLLQTIAQELLTNTYENNFRARPYKSQRTPWVVSKELKIGSQSHYDNPTGIFFKEGKKQHVFVGKGAPITLAITDFRENGQTEKIVLTEGINTFASKVSGSGYIQYYTDGKTMLPNVNIHFAYGDEVGFWDIRNGDSQEDYSNLLSMAETCYTRLDHTDGFITVLGEKSQLLNTVSAFRQHCKDVNRIIEIHDQILEIEYTMMGLVANNAVPVNRKLSRRTWGGPPNWGGSSANFPNSEAEMLSEKRLLQSLWVFGHELGHGNQINPHMKMTGWGETTNNVYAVSLYYKLGDVNNLRLEHETVSRKQGDTEPAVIGGRYNAYLNEAHVVKEPYLTHEGPDYKKGSMNGTGLRGDHFVKLVPLWQLTLYFDIAGEGNSWHTDSFWAPINWKAINDDRTNLSNGERFVNFMKNCMDSGKTDLSDFFETIGLLRVVDRSIDDYAVGQLVITQSQVDEVKQYGKKYPKTSALISYISANSVEAYKNKLSVEGTYNSGVASENNGAGVGLRVDHNTWKNVTVFETYNNDELIDVSMVGSASKDKSSTYVRYPVGATRLEAVSYDGKRTLVYGER